MDSYKPKLGGKIETSFPPQFPYAKIDGISMAVTPIHQLSLDGDETILSHGTGFFWRSAKGIFLVTARHVLSGRNPFDNAFMSPKNFIPQCIRAYPVACPNNDNQWTRGEVIVELGDPDEPAWLQDPLFEDLRTDIAAVSISALQGMSVRCLNDYGDMFRHHVTQVGFELAVVGYPFANVIDAMTPIWRRGVIASEPLLPVDGKPMFLIDGTTSPGFSGAPVFRRQVGASVMHDAQGVMETNVMNVVTTSLVGVYAGRLQHQHYGGEIPFAFYANRIGLIIDQ